MLIAQCRGYCLHPLVKKHFLSIPALPPATGSKCGIGCSYGNYPDLGSILAHKRSRPARMVIAGDEQDFMGTVRAQILVNERRLAPCGIELVVQRSKKGSRIALPAGVLNGLSRLMAQKRSRSTDKYIAGISRPRQLRASDNARSECVSA